MQSPVTIKEIQVGAVRWIDVLRPTQADLEQLSEEFHLDYFTVKDCLEPGHLPKIEHTPSYSFVILRAYANNTGDNLSTVQEISDKVAFFYNEQFLITIHRPFFSFIPMVQDQIEQQRIIEVTDIVTELFWQIVNSFRIHAENQSHLVDDMEETIFLKQLRGASLENLYYQKSEVRISKKLLLLSQQVVMQYKTHEDGAAALQNVRDLLVKLILEYDEALDDIHNLMQTYLSVASQKNNDVMKLLTVFSVFFLPITFLAGLYGMNFDHMPELHWTYGYPILLAVMAGISVFILLWFRRKQIL